jgi:serine/threonine-protein kinase RsbW
MAVIVHLQALSRTEDLGPMRTAVMAFLAPHGLSERTLYDVDLVLEELFMNIVLHAHEDGLPHHVDLWVELETESVLLCFEDRGRPFDPAHRPEPARPASIAEARPGGLGLSLVRQRSTSMTYSRRDDRNQLSVTIRRR